VTTAGIHATLSATVISVSLLLLVMTLIWWLDRYDRQPNRLVLAGFMWGATAAPLLSLAFVSIAQGWWISDVESTAAAGWLAVMEIATFEILKGVAVVLIVVYSTSFDNPTDGIVYGTAVSLGFALTLNAYHPATRVDVFLDAGMSVPPAARMLIVAGLHATAGGVFGGCAGMARLSRRTTVRLAWVTAGLMAAMLVHGCRYMIAVLPAGVGGQTRWWLMTVFALCAMYPLMVSWFYRAEHRILEVQLNQEVEFGTVPPWVVEIIPYYRRRVRSTWWPLRGERTVLARLLARLAFRKHAVDHLPDEEARIAGLEVVQLRNRIRHMLEPVSSREND
jgi:RsiW-degrading membrane proteinase PrsW (M82 family)